MGRRELDPPNQFIQPSTGAMSSSTVTINSFRRSISHAEVMQMRTSATDSATIRQGRATWTPRIVRSKTTGLPNQAEYEGEKRLASSFIILIVLPILIATPISVRSRNSSAQDYGSLVEGTDSKSSSELNTRAIAITRLELWVGLIYDASLGFREE